MTGIQTDRSAEEVCGLIFLSLIFTQRMGLVNCNDELWTVNVVAVEYLGNG